MAKGKELFDLMAKAEAEGVTMSELAHRSNSVRRAKARKEKLAQERDQKFEQLQLAGRDWWNN